ncbi:MAG: hypothetical protein ACI9MR_001148 [Myxococcota bacterium]|jgi:hypothetical protein
MTEGTTMSDGNWHDFMTHLKKVHWPSLAPVARLESRPNPPADEPIVPDDIWQAVLMVFPNPEAWLHNPIPQAKGKTPLELIKRGKDDDLRVIVRQVSSFFLPDPSEVVPWQEYEDAVAAAEAEAAAEKAD